MSNLQTDTTTGCPSINDLPNPPEGKKGWPWIEETTQEPEKLEDGSQWPRVTVITPSYNQGQFIESTIRSVLLQGYPNLEYIINDGGSTDNTIDIIRKYDKWISRWSCKPDNGQADAINKGWKIATGEFLAWINSDDEYMPNAIHNAIKAYIKNSRIGMIYGDAVCIDSEGEYLGHRRSFEGAAKHILWFGQRSYVVQPTTFIRAEVIKNVGYLDENLNSNLDYDLFIRIVKSTPTMYLPKTFAKIRLHNAIKSFNPHQNWEERKKVIRRYNKLWFISPIMFIYLRFKFWTHLPHYIRTQFRKLLGRPRDIVWLNRDNKE